MQRKDIRLPFMNNPIQDIHNLLPVILLWGVYSARPEGSPPWTKQSVACIPSYRSEQIKYQQNHSLYLQGESTWRELRDFVSSPDDWCIKPEIQQHATQNIFLFSINILSLGLTQNSVKYLVIFLPLPYINNHSTVNI